MNELRVSIINLGHELSKVKHDRVHVYLLDVIYDACNQDEEKAQQVIENLAKDVELL